MELHSTVSPWQRIDARAERPAVAIADVHGRADLLEGMFEHLDRHLPGSAQVVLLGDLTDRGPESLRTIDLAIAGCPRRETVAICGNHDAMLLGSMAVKDPRSMGALVLWVKNGGFTVLDELHLDGDTSPQDLMDALGDERLLFLRGMEKYVRNGDVLFVHAGIDPRKPLAAQLEQPVYDFMEMEDEHESIRWIREPWVGHDKSLEDGVFVVCGHTIQRSGRPLVTRCQAMIDLGAYSRNVLCAAEFDGASSMRFHFMGEYDRISALADHYAGRKPRFGFIPA